MASSSGIAQSGLQVAALSVDVSASNIASTLTEGFVPSRVDGLDVLGGGTTADVQSLDGPAKAPQDPLAEVRADRALLVPSQVDLTQELMNQSRAAAVYQANLATLKTDQETQATLMQMVKNG